MPLPLLTPDQLLLSFPAREVDLQLYRPHAVGVLSTDSYGDDHYKYIEQARLILAVIITTMYVCMKTYRCCSVIIILEMTRRVWSSP